MKDTSTPGKETILLNRINKSTIELSPTFYQFASLTSKTQNLTYITIKSYSKSSKAKEEKKIRLLDTFEVQKVRIHTNSPFGGTFGRSFFIIFKKKMRRLAKKISFSEEQQKLFFRS